MARRTKSNEQRLRILLKNIPKSNLEQANELASNILAIEDKLYDSREKIWGMDIVIPYDNGGGQKGLRENPAYKAYCSLLNSYQKALKQLEEMKNEDTKSSIFDWNR